MIHLRAWFKRWGRVSKSRLVEWIERQVYTDVTDCFASACTSLMRYEKIRYIPLSCSFGLFSSPPFLSDLSSPRLLISKFMSVSMLIIKCYDRELYRRRTESPEKKVNILKSILRAFWINLLDFYTTVTTYSAHSICWSAQLQLNPSKAPAKLSPPFFNSSGITFFSIKGNSIYTFQTSAFFLSQSNNTYEWSTHLRFNYIKT